MGNIEDQLQYLARKLFDSWDVRRYGKLHLPVIIEQFLALSLSPSAELAELLFSGHISRQINADKKRGVETNAD